MKKILNFIWQTLLWIWQLPQNLVGLCVLWWARNFGKISRVYKLDAGVKAYYVVKLSGGVTLGNYIFIHDYAMHFAKGQRQTNTEKHEYGHTIQSKILGPLYLFVIGIPSIVHAAIHDDKKHGSYYHFYTEKWADKLGGVKRKN